MKKLGFGLMRLPIKENAELNNINIELLKRMVDTFMSKGFTYYDTAYVYHGGFSEVAFKEAVVKRYPRESYTITDKMPMFSVQKEEDLLTIFNTQLSRCGVDYFDFYWLHALGKDTFFKSEQMGAFEFLKSQKEAGKIKHIGFSFHDSAEVLEMILSKHPEVEYVQLQINYIDWESDNVQARKCYEVACKYHTPVIVMEPVKGGALVNLPLNADAKLKELDVNASNASWAIRFAASLENVYMVLSGMSNLEQVEDNTSYMQDFKPLTMKEKETIDEVTNYIKNTITIPCTNCRYCVDGCPQKIAIPDYFAIFNGVKNLSISSWEGKGRIKKISETKGLPSICINCKKCEKICPQHIKITSYLKDISKDLQ